MNEKLMDLLNDYYGDTKDDTHKEEVINFIGGYADKIRKILENEAGIEGNEMFWGHARDLG